MCRTLATVGLAENENGGAVDDPEQIAVCLHLKERFMSRRWIQWVLVDEDSCDLATFEPLENGFRPGDPHDVTGQRLSRFSYVKRDGADFMMLSPETACRMTLRSDKVLKRIWHSSSPLDDGQANEAIFVALGQFGFLEPGLTEESAERASWTFADAILHSSSRRGRDEPIVGENLDLQKRFPPPQARLVPTGKTHTLTPVRDKNQLATERRRSCRKWHASPIPLPLVSSFLQRLSAVHESFDAGGLERLDKPIPAAGSIHELEWYIAVGNVSGLEQGLYRYCGFEHTLDAVPGSADAAAEMLQNAGSSMGATAEVPPALIMLTTRMPRIAWKYKGMAYRLTLLNAGIALDAMYNTATELDLGGCAIGTGDPRPFQRVTGLSWFEESPVVEFALGLPK
ncbi:SagB family peptide dehydrogenase [Ruegeria sp. A3M17]|uniref:SagB family peptide dehydrogenase n=1 Tax=Ruegeria sp. A3M17 TaxID=2267229 RepID=UPI0011BE0964|nr:SagB family peptide dehydrogenase [Ruegeria sp. A3M17]